MKRPNRSRAGWTVLEGVIALALFTTLLTGATTALNSSMQLYRTTSSQIELDRRLDRVCARMRDELMTATVTSLEPVLVNPVGGPPAWTDTMTFAQVTGWQDDDVVLAGNRRLSVELEDGELDDGVDQDGDGLVDERQVTLTLDVGTADERTLVLARGVLELFPGETLDGADENGNLLEDEAGFSITSEEGLLTIRLALGETMPDDRVTVRTRTFSVVLVN